MGTATKQPDNQVGERVKDVRKFYTKSQTEFAVPFGITYSSIGCIERGEVNLTIPHLIILHDKFKINLNWLICGDGNMIIDNSQPSLSETMLSEIDPNINTVLYKSLEDKERLIMAQEQLIEYLKKDAKA
jgi:transcriptional regulator with XRE-family HTH domain